METKHRAGKNEATKSLKGQSFERCGCTGRISKRSDGVRENRIGCKTIVLTTKEGKPVYGFNS
jgi:hypothetical protein